MGLRTVKMFGKKRKMGEFRYAISCNLLEEKKWYANAEFSRRSISKNEMQKRNVRKQN